MMDGGEREADESGLAFTSTLTTRRFFAQILLTRQSLKPVLT